MKKLILFTLLTLSVAFSCQKESFNSQSDEEIAATLTQDQTFINAVNKLNDLIVKSESINLRELERVNNLQNEKEMQNALIEFGLKNKIDGILQEMNVLLKKYGERINEETILLALKKKNWDLGSSERKVLESKLKTLRYESLPCTDVMNADMAVATSAYLGGLLACLATGPYWAVCDVAASLGYLAATNKILKDWNFCMWDQYGWLPEP